MPENCPNSGKTESGSSGIRKSGPRTRSLDLKEAASERLIEKYTLKPGCKSTSSVSSPDIKEWENSTVSLQVKEEFKFRSCDNLLSSDNSSYEDAFEDSDKTAIDLTDKERKMDQAEIVELLKKTMEINLSAMQTTMQSAMAAEREANRQQIESLTTQFAPLVQAVQTNQAAIQNTPSAASTVTIHVAKYIEGSDIDVYLSMFERAATQNNWHRTTWAVRLQALLSGKAAEAAALVPPTESNNYDRIKETILRRFQITSETYRQRFRTIAKESDQSFTDYGNKLEQLMLKWLDCSDYKTINDVAQLQGYIEGILRKLLVEQYISSIKNEQLRIRLREFKDPTLEDVSRIAESYFLARKDERETTKFQGPPKQKTAPPKAKPETDKPDEGQSAEAAKSKTAPPKYTSGPCYNCGRKGHRAKDCRAPRKKEETMLARSPSRDVNPQQQFQLYGEIEGKPAKILVDSGATLTIVHQKFVSPEENGKDQTEICCVHGDHRTYPVRKVHITAGEKGEIYKGEIEVAVSKTLPVDAIIGHTFPGFLDLCRPAVRGKDTTAAVLLTTRSQTYDQQFNRSIDIPENDVTHIDVDIGEYNQKEPMSRRQKRKAKDIRRREQTTAFESDEDPTTLNAKQLSKLQAEDKSLEGCWKKANQGQGFKISDGLLYRVIESRLDGTEQWQLVLPRICRKAVLRISHDIPMSGHTGRARTADRILQRFFWPALRNDVARYVRSCEVCQLTAKTKPRERVPMVQMPIITEPFRRVAIDIVGPLTPVRNGFKFMLVYSDYGTRYPEVFPLRTTNARKIAEALEQCFCRLGVPEEILTDQGSNFLS